MESERRRRPPPGGLGARLAAALGRRLPGERSATETAWFEGAVEEFERRVAEILRQASEDLHAQFERDLAATEGRLQERLEAALVELRAKGDEQLAAELARVKATAEAPLAQIRRAETQIDAATEKLGVRARRQELKLIREENSARIAGALARLESQAEARKGEVDAVRLASQSLLDEVDQRIAAAVSASGELERRLQETERRLVETERREQATAGVVADADGKLEQAIESVEQAERRVVEIADRVAAVARRIAELGDSAERAAEWEGRIVAAVDAEADLAQRINDAERRLVERVDPGDES